MASDPLSMLCWVRNSVAWSVALGLCPHLCFPKAITASTRLFSYLFPAIQFQKQNSLVSMKEVRAARCTLDAGVGRPQDKEPKHCLEGGGFCVQSG